MANQNTEQEDTVRRPPFSEEGEVGVLGALLQNGDLIDNCFEAGVDGDAFYVPAHRVVFDAALALWQKRRPIDVLSVTDKLRESDELDRVGGVTFVHRLVEVTPTTAHFDYYLEIVKNKSDLRKIIQAARDIETQAYEPDVVPEELSGLGQKAMFDITATAVAGETNAAVIAEIIDDCERAERGEHDGLPCFLRACAERIGYYQFGKCYYVSAKPKHGKSTFLQNEATHWALGLGVPTAVASIEMTHKEIVKRILAERSNLSTHRLDQGKECKGWYEKMFPHIEKMVDVDTGDMRAPLWINDKRLNILQLEAWARLMVRKHGVKALIVDHLHILKGTPGKKKDLRQEVVEVVEALSRIAKELNIVILIAAQLTKAARQSTKPGPDDIREAGNILDEAYAIVMLYYEKDAWFCDVQANRGGRTGREEVKFNKSKQRWEMPPDEPIEMF